MTLISPVDPNQWKFISEVKMDQIGLKKEKDPLELFVFLAYLKIGSKK